MAMNTAAVEALRKYRETGKPRKPRKKVNHMVMTMDNKPMMVEGLTPLLAIKMMCTRCFCFEGNPKKICTSLHCPLYPFRASSRVARHSDPALNVGSDDDEDGAEDDDNQEDGAEDDE